MENKTLKLLDKNEESKVKIRAQLLGLGLTLGYILLMGTLIASVYGLDIMSTTGYYIGVLFCGSGLVFYIVATQKMLAAQGCANVLIMAEDAAPGEEGLPREIAERFQPGTLIWRAIWGKRRS